MTLTQPSPGRRGGRPRCLALSIDLKNRVDYGLPHQVLAIIYSEALFQVGVNLQYPPHQFPLPQGEGSSFGTRHKYQAATVR